MEEISLNGKYHTEQIHYWYRSLNIGSVTRWPGHVQGAGETRIECKLLSDKPKGSRPHGRH